MTSSCEMDTFIELSAVLTGFSKQILAPSLDPVDIKSVYFPYFNQQIAKESGNENLPNQIYGKFSDLKHHEPPLTNQKLGEEMLDASNGEDFVMACKKLIFMWYSGAWPEVIAATGTQPDSTVSNMISDKSYTCGLAWQVMQSHPMGDSNYRYGYWAEQPADLQHYTKGN